MASQKKDENDVVDLKHHREITNTAGVPGGDGPSESHRQSSHDNSPESAASGPGFKGQDRRDSSGVSGGHMGAGRSGKEDLGSEKPQDDLGSNRPDHGAGGARPVDDDPTR